MFLLTKANDVLAVPKQNHVLFEKKEKSQQNQVAVLLHALLFVKLGQALVVQQTDKNNNRDGKKQTVLTRSCSMARKQTTNFN